MGETKPATAAVMLMTTRATSADFSWILMVWLIVSKVGGARKAASEQDRALVEQQNFNLEADVTRTYRRTDNDKNSKSQPYPEPPDGCPHQDDGS